MYTCLQLYQLDTSVIDKLKRATMKFARYLKEKKNAIKYFINQKKSLCHKKFHDTHEC